MNRDVIGKRHVEPWLIWGAAAFFAFFALFLQTSVSVMIDPLKETFNITNIGIGFLASSFFYTYAFMQIPIGALIDKYGVRRILALSVVGTFYSCLLFSYAGSFTSVIVTRIAMGLFAASAFPCAFCLAAVWFPKKLFPTVVGFTEMLGMFGGAFAANVLSMSVVNYGWRSTSLLCACLAATLGFIVIYSVKDRKLHGMITNRGVINQSVSRIEDDEAIKNSTISQKLKKVFKNRQMWCLSLYAGLMFVPLSTFAALWGIPFVMDKYGVKLECAANCMVLAFLGGAIGNPVVAWLSHKLNRKKEFMFLGTVLSLVFISIILYIKLYFPILLLMIFLLGFVSTVYIIPFSIVKEMITEDIRGTAMSFTNAICGGIGTLLMEPLAGYLIYHYSTSQWLKSLPLDPYTFGLSIIPLCLIVALFFLFKVKEPEKQTITVNTEVYEEEIKKGKDTETQYN